MKRTILLLVPVASLLCIWACVEGIKATTQFGVPAIKATGAVVKAARPISEDEEYYLGRTVAARILTQYPLDKNPDARRYVNLIGQVLALHSDKPETFGGYHFAIAETDDINAMSCPGGAIFITRGMIKLAEDEDELAAVLAHEIAHVVNRDGVNTIKPGRWAQASVIIAASAVQAYGSDSFARLTNLFEESAEDVVQTLVVKGYSRKQEYAADETALNILARAGYDPGALPRVIDRLRTKGGTGDSGFLKTHPDSAARLENAKNHLASLNKKPETSSKRMARFAAMQTAF